MKGHLRFAKLVGASRSHFGAPWSKGLHIPLLLGLCWVPNLAPSRFPEDRFWAQISPRKAPGALREPSGRPSSPPSDPHGEAQGWDRTRSGAQQAPLRQVLKKGNIF